MKIISRQQKQEFSGLLMLWDKDNSRDMPWKGEKDPYKIWLSEIILQQTRVEQGKPYYERFIRQYPTVSDLAMADQQAVFRLWQGLGYYNRCKNMLAAARKICTEYQCRFPDTYSAILELPGIGEYTASAIASFAFGLPHAVVDGNVQRVLARYFGIALEVNSTAGKKYFAALANEVMYKKDPAAYNQAIMDFGATVCTPRQPECDSCPLQKKCFAYRHRSISVLPVKTPKAKPKNRYFSYLVLCYDNRIYLHRRSGNDIWQNLHEFVCCEVKQFPDETEWLQQEPARTMLKGNSVRSVQISEVYRQQLTHQVIHARFIFVKLLHPLRRHDEYFSVPTKQLNNYAFPKIIVRYLRHIELLK
jgi:A/G-specific adenine glycosylase